MLRCWPLTIGREGCPRGLSCWSCLLEVDISCVRLFVLAISVSVDLERWVFGCWILSFALGDSQSWPVNLSRWAVKEWRPRIYRVYRDSLKYKLLSRYQFSWGPFTGKRMEERKGMGRGKNGRDKERKPEIQRQSYGLELLLMYMIRSANATLKWRDCRVQTAESTHSLTHSHTLTHTHTHTV